MDQYRFNLDYHNKLADNGDFSFKYDLAYNFVEEYELNGWGQR